MTSRPRPGSRPALTLTVAVSPTAMADDHFQFLDHEQIASLRKALEAR